jgi:AraC family transcriptional regulator
MSAKNALPEIMFQTRTSQGIGVQLRRDPAGVLKVPALDPVIVGIHLGAPTRLECRRAGRFFVGTAVQGDINIIPSGTPSRWEVIDGSDTGLFLSVPRHLINSIVRESGVEPGSFEILNRFHIRDKELEILAWAMKRELELGSPSGRLYLEGLGVAVASRLVMVHSSIAKRVESNREGLADRRLKQALAFIEEYLSHDLSLGQIASVVGLSASHLKAVFAKALGISVHQYVIQRRVERAKKLLTGTDLSIAEVALSTGFSHQSHLARHTRRLLGVAPGVIRRASIGRDPA